MEKRSIITSKDRKIIFEEIDDFSDKLWDIIEERKIEAIEYRLEIMKGISESELSQGIMETTIALIQTELEKFISLSNLISDFQYQCNGEEQHKFDMPTISLEDSDCAENDVFETLNHYSDLFKNSVINSDLTSQERQELSTIFLRRVEEVTIWARKELTAMKNKVQYAYAILDDWITDSVTGENEHVKILINHWKSCLTDRKKIELKIIESNEKVLSYLRVGIS